jgi:hypothetical protein
MRRDRADPAQLTEKQSAFADAFNSNGGDATAAYRAIYDCRRMNPASVRAAASYLARHPGVSILIAAVKEAGKLPAVMSENPADVSKPWLIQQAMRTYNEAVRAGQPGAAKNALELIGKLTGILVERKELRVIRSIEDLTDEELSAIVASDRSDGDETRHTDQL